MRKCFSNIGKDTTDPRVAHTSNLSRIPRIYPCKFFLAGVNFYRFNAKNWHFDRFYVKKWLFFYRFNAKNWRFSVKILFSKNFARVKEMTNIRYVVAEAAEVPILIVLLCAHVSVLVLTLTKLKVHFEFSF